MPCEVGVIRNFRIWLFFAKYRDNVSIAGYLEMSITRHLPILWFEDSVWARQARFACEISSLGCFSGTVWWACGHRLTGCQ
jgi:hypothetical protein